MTRLPSLGRFFCHPRNVVLIAPLDAVGEPFARADGALLFECAKVPLHCASVERKPFSHSVDRRRALAGLQIDEATQFEKHTTHIFPESVSIGEIIEFLVRLLGH